VLPWRHRADQLCGLAEAQAQLAVLAADDDIAVPRIAIGSRVVRQRQRRLAVLVSRGFSCLAKLSSAFASAFFTALS
jgi:hypothetical protein